MSKFNKTLIAADSGLVLPQAPAIIRARTMDSAMQTFDAATVDSAGAFLIGGGITAWPQLLAELQASLARLVAERLGCPAAEVDRLILPDEKTYAERPRDFRLASDKIQAAGIELGTFEEDLDLCLQDLGLALRRDGRFFSPEPTRT